MQVTNRLMFSAAAVAAIGVCGAIEAQAALTLVDNFNGYDNSAITTIGSNGGGDATGGVWQGVFNGTANARIYDDLAQDDGGAADNMLQVFGTGTAWRGAEANLKTAFGADRGIPDGDAATTLYLQFQAKDPGNNNMDSVWGLAQDVAAISEASPWNDFAVMGVVGGPNNTNIDFRVHDGSANGGAASDVTIIDNMAMETWYNAWFVVNEGAQTFDVYTSTGTDAGVYAGTFDFGRFVNPAGLGAIGFAEVVSSSGANPDAALRIDNIYMTSGVDTSFPVPEPAGMALVGLGAVGVFGRRRKA